MKKIRKFLSSMTFGLILMGLITVCSIAGSLIAQQKSVSWYAETYSNFHGIILLLGIDDVFHGWFFITLLALLCLNLFFCTLLRIKGVVRGLNSAVDTASKLPPQFSLTDAGKTKLTEYLASNRYRKEEMESVCVWHKNEAGRFGSFFTHLAILLIIVFGALALYLPNIQDTECMPGSSVVMEDGTDIAVQSFHIENSSGELDYASVINVTLPNGTQSGPTEISVNYPLSYGRYKIYQQTYGTAGAIRVYNPENDATEDFIMDDVTFLSIDGTNGLWFEVLYAGYLRDEDGNFTLISSVSGSYEDPVYQVLTAVDGVYTPVLAFPGESLTVGGLTFTMLDPVEYPGLRIKTEPVFANTMLIMSFVLLLLGLYLCFFCQPVLVTVSQDGYAVSGPKNEGAVIELDALLEADRQPFGCTQTTDGSDNASLPDYNIAEESVEPENGGTQNA